jgi:hypothetical protein
MMDRITAALLREFSHENELIGMQESQRFEHFAAYLAVSRFYTETFDTGDVVVGEGSDTGIDAIAVLVNGALLTDPELVEEYSERNGFLDAVFVFVQASTGTFNASKVGNFGYGVTDFFKQKPTLPRNNKVSAASEVMNAVYERSSKFKKGNPVCKLYHVTTGR